MLMISFMSFSFLDSTLSMRFRAPLYGSIISLGIYFVNRNIRLGL